MKKIFYLSLSLVLLFLGFEFLGSNSCSIAKTNNKFIGDRTNTVKLSLNIAGMTCQNCAQIIKSNLKKDKGVISCNINYKNKNSAIIYDPAKTSEKIILETINNAGFKAELLKSKEQNVKKSEVYTDGCCTTIK